MTFAHKRRLRDILLICALFSFILAVPFICSAEEKSELRESPLLEEPGLYQIRF